MRPYTALLVVVMSATSLGAQRPAGGDDRAALLQRIDARRDTYATVLAGDKHHPTYRALVIDVGAFTTDFASLWVDTKGRSADTSDGASRARYQAR